MATHEIVDRLGNSAGAALRAAILAPAAPAAQKAHALWALERTGELDAATLASLKSDAAALVRVHVAKALAERPKWTDADAAWVVAALKDPDGFVRRAAADALGRHPDSSRYEPLLAALAAAPNEDSLLRHTLKMALRDHLAAAPKAWPYPGNEAGQRALFASYLGVPSDLTNWKTYSAASARDTPR